MRMIETTLPTSSARACLVSEYVRVDGLRMHARVSARAPRRDQIPVVLVHGMVVSSRYMKPLAEILAADMDVYAPDLPGFGKSEAGSWAADVPGLAAGLDRWMDALGLEQALVVGNSLGCQIAARLAGSYPHRARELVLLGPMVEPSARNLFVLAARGLVNAGLEPPSLGAVIMRDLWAIGLPRAFGVLRGMLADRIETTLPAVSVPTTIVRGERDPLVSEPWVHQLCSLLPRYRMVVIPNAGHALNYNAPEQVAALVRDLLDVRNATSRNHATIVA